MILNKLLLQKHRRLKVGLVVADGLFFGITDPTRAPSICFIVGFILLTLSIFVVIDGLFHLAAWYGFDLKHRVRLVATVGGGICGLLALQSMGQLSGRDMLLLLPLATLAYFYLAYNQRRYV